MFVDRGTLNNNFSIVQLVVLVAVSLITGFKSSTERIEHVCVNLR